jgi:hypothetical protein
MKDLTDYTPMDILKQQRDTYSRTISRMRKFLMEKGLEKEYDDWVVAQAVVKRMTEECGK